MPSPRGYDADGVLRSYPSYMRCPDCKGVMTQPPPLEHGPLRHNTYQCGQCGICQDYDLDTRRRGPKWRPTFEQGLGFRRTEVGA